MDEQSYRKLYELKNDNKIYEIIYPLVSFLCFLAMKDKITVECNDSSEFTIYSTTYRLTLVEKYIFRIKYEESKIEYDIRFEINVNGYRDASGRLIREKTFKNIKDLVKEVDLPEYFIKAYDMLKKPDGFKRLENGELRGAIHGHNFNI